MDQLTSPGVFEATFSVMADVMAQGIDLEFRKQDKILSPDSLDWLSKQMSDEMAVLMADRVRDDYVAAYAALLSDEALAGLRAFLETPAGQAFAASQPALTREGAAIGNKHADTIAQEAATIVIGAVQRGEFPDDLSVTTQRELSELFPK